jgi:hypothetical protein
MTTQEPVPLDPVFTGALHYVDHALPVTDGHADPLREWTADGDVTPSGWFAVRVSMRHHTPPLFMIREVYGTLSGFMHRGVWYAVSSHTSAHASLSRQVWWTPSEELSCEVARQYMAGERCAAIIGEYMPAHGMQSYRTEHVYRRTRAWRSEVYERMPDGSARLVRRYGRTTPHLNAAWWEDGHRPPMKTWGSQGQSPYVMLDNEDGMRVR